MLLEYRQGASSLLTGRSTCFAAAIVTPVVNFFPLRMANREGLETCLAQNTEKQHFFYGLYGKCTFLDIYFIILFVHVSC